MLKKEGGGGEKQKIYIQNSYQNIGNSFNHCRNFLYFTPAAIKNSSSLVNLNKITLKLLEVKCSNCILCC